LKINIFIPPQFTKEPLDIKYLNNITNKQWQYASNGRASIYQILKPLNITKILVPIYICETILVPLKKLNIKPIFYDIEQEDLNPSLESIKKLSKKYEVKTILVASMYGNPANLLEIEKYCSENDIFLIDDAAQSFKAKLNNRFIGTFGDAGFFSFSPGKPTSGHMGSFFWSREKVSIKRTSHCLVHYFRWLDFYHNRYNVYENKNKLYKKTVNLISRVLLKFVDIDNDNICNFEENILGGILNETFSFRNKYQNEFVKLFENSENFKVVKSIRGEANNHKFVIIFTDIPVAQEFIKFMQINEIFILNGYTLLTDDLKDLPNAKSINKKVIELPIEDDSEKMRYLFEKVKEFDVRYSI